MSRRSVHAIVVTYGAADQVARCLGALEGEVPVTIVDNSSSAAICAAAEQHGAVYVDSGSNLGFAAGVNVVLADLRRAEMDVLLVNPDVVVSPKEVWELERYLHQPQNERVAAVAPRLVCPQGSEQKVAWPFPSPARMWAEAVGLGRLSARSTFVVGAVLLLRSEAIDEIGLFDERFFLYAEEADWQRRALERGWTSAVCTNAVAEHTGGGASTSARRREALFHAAQETYIRKWNGPTGWLRYRLAACLGAGLRTLLFTSDRRSEAARRMLLYVRGPRRSAALDGE